MEWGTEPFLFLRDVGMVSPNVIRKLMSVISGAVCDKGAEETTHPQRDTKSLPTLQSCWTLVPRAWAHLCGWSPRRQLNQGPGRKKRRKWSEYLVSIHLHPGDYRLKWEKKEGFCLFNYAQICHKSLASSGVLYLLHPLFDVPHWTVRRSFQWQTKKALQSSRVSILWGFLTPYFSYSTILSPNQRVMSLQNAY